MEILLRQYAGAWISMVDGLPFLKCEYKWGLLDLYDDMLIYQ